VKEKNGIGRSFALVIRRASAGLSNGAIKTFITPSCGAIQPSHFPSGLRVPPLRTGLPNRASRVIRGTWVMATPWVYCHRNTQGCAGLAST
jgi:hypothetical protein